MPYFLLHSMHIVIQNYPTKQNCYIKNTFPNYSSINPRWTPTKRETKVLPILKENNSKWRCKTGQSRGKTSRERARSKVAKEPRQRVWVVRPRDRFRLQSYARRGLDYKDSDILGHLAARAWTFRWLPSFGVSRLDVYLWNFSIFISARSLMKDITFLC